MKTDYDDDRNDDNDADCNYENYDCNDDNDESDNVDNGNADYCNDNNSSNDRYTDRIDVIVTVNGIMMIITVYVIIFIIKYVWGRCINL